MTHDHTPQTHRRTRHRWLRRCSAVLVAGVTSLSLASAPAAARPEDGFGPLGRVVDTRSGPAEVGQYHLGNRVAYCIDLDAWGPREASGWRVASLRGARKQVGFGDRAGAATLTGEAFTERERAELAYLLDWAGQRELTLIEAIAVDHLIRLRGVGDDEQLQRLRDRYAAATRQFPGLAELVEELQRRVSNLHGPYRIEAGRDTGGRLTVVIRSATGAAVTGVDLTVLVDGQQVKTRATGGTHTVRVPRDADIRVRAEVPATEPQLWIARHHGDLSHRDSTIQRMLVESPREGLELTVAPDEPVPSTPAPATPSRPAPSTPTTPVASTPVPSTPTKPFTPTTTGPSTAVSTTPRPSPTPTSPSVPTSTSPTAPRPTSQASTPTMTANRPATPLPSTGGGATGLVLGLTMVAGALLWWVRRR
ncbi:LPXTG cell wall anchor domain-containing protein [Parenemella sanctibonifatiensis]|uniref:LPXTG cell wall anchor domain-containing protein n=1 Tax=Parenemella sanctibonifatiensis TaxID=2016505 RepID=A0A255EKE4_9ACTN|nr:LPXTG cell wall anchor domain-containing protein [Parenemella sanctibonifatiensis]OYN92008.1 hypothetical protein CGZ91_00290 [Parenemella sanctibonifatiensis]